VFTKLGRNLRITRPITHTHTHTHVYLTKQATRKGEAPIVLATNEPETRGQSNLTKSASRGAHSPVRGHPRGSKVVPLNSWGRVSY